MVTDLVQDCERNRNRVREKDEIFYFGEGEKAEWQEGENSRVFVSFCFM